MSIKKNLKSFSLVLAFTVICFSLSSSSAFAQFAGGDGSESSPYQIETCDQLQNIGATNADNTAPYLDSYFILTKDIDCSVTSTWNEDSGNPGTYFGFKAIYYYDAVNDINYPFTGSFDGNNFTISNLYINRPTEYRVSLFGYNSESSIFDLNLTNVNITGGGVGGISSYSENSELYNLSVGGSLTLVSELGSIGGIAGELFFNSSFNSTFTIENCHFSGSISTISGEAGGLFGSAKLASESTGTITINNSSSSGVVTSDSEYSYPMGGLIGYNQNINISNSFSSANVNGLGSSIGGLVGENQSGNFNHTYSTGTVTGGYSIGGLIGYNIAGRVLNSYSTSQVSGSDSVGGLIGYNKAGHIENTYATGNVEGNGVKGRVGGLIGSNTSFSKGGGANTIVNSYATGNITGTNYIGGLIGINVTDLVVNSYSTGSVSSSAVGATAVGGFIGSLQYDGDIGSTDSADRYSSNNGWLKSDGLSAIGEIVSFKSSDFTFIYQGPASVTHEETDASVFYSKDHDIYDFGGVNAWDFITPIWYEWTNTFPKFEAQAAEPTSTSAPTNNNSGSGSNPGSPLFESCHDPKPTGISDLFQIDTASTNAKLFFTPIVDADRYYISFSSVNPNSAEEHGELVTLTKEGVQSHTVYKLKPNTVYYVKVRGQRGCMPGDWSTILKIKTTSNNSNIVSYYKYSKTGLSTIINKTKNVVKTKISASTSETTLPNSTVTPVPTAEVTPKVETKKTTTESTSTESTSTESTSTESTTPSNKKCFLWWCW
ncbi:MAG: fibronectin type III domain-containing protein [Candidatus Shapirobacteria bacterium]|nr:fibronectin type III domain-containing protein [Candidatus Shapirobacteria bacterium]